jgi:hypothetical protein
MFVIPWGFTLCVFVYNVSHAFPASCISRVTIRRRGKMYSNSISIICPSTEAVMHGTDQDRHIVFLSLHIALAADIVITCH